MEKDAGTKLASRGRPSGEPSLCSSTPVPSCCQEIMESGFKAKYILSTTAGSGVCRSR
jgi:hypothetical protein